MLKLISCNNPILLKMSNQTLLIIYKTHLQQLHGSYALVAQEDPRLWHDCFQRLYYDSLQQLPSSQMVHDLPHFNVNNISCEALYTWEAPPSTFSRKTLIVPHSFRSRCICIYVVQCNMQLLEMNDTSCLILMISNAKLGTEGYP